MKQIFISMSGVFEQHGGPRIDRIPDYEEVGFKEDRATFKRHKGRRIKLKKDMAIPYQISSPSDTPEVTVTLANWKGRRMRDAVNPNKRRMLPVKKT